MLGRRLKAAVPYRLIGIGRRLTQGWRLSRLPVAKIDCVSLISSREFDVARVFEDSARGAVSAANDEIGAVATYGDFIGATNPGDRCAIYALVRWFRPKRVLEVGTHVGASTLYIAKALDAQRSPCSIPRLVTVDVRDVNDTQAALWKRYGAQLSPLDTLRALGCIDLVDFVVSSSIEFWKHATNMYDFIFLDGCHDADVVYEDIVGSLRILNRGGCILLHDYFPKGRRLWSDGKVIPGPFLAVRRLRSEGVRIQPIPLGELPWKTKALSTLSSLAVLVTDDTMAA